MYFLWLWLKYPLRRERQLSVKLRERKIFAGELVQKERWQILVFFYGVYKSRMNLFFIFLLVWDIDFINQNIFWDLIIFFVEFCNSHKTHD